MATIELRLYNSVHLYYEFINTAGQRMGGGQINGLATNPVTGKPTPFGTPWNGNDEIWVFSSEYLNGTYNINASSGDVIFTGTDAQVSFALACIKELSRFINAQHFDYVLIPISNNDYNSNSVANTVWNFLQDILALPSGTLRDFNGFLPGISNDILQDITWLPNLNSAGNVIGSNIIGGSTSDDLVTDSGSDILIGYGGNDDLNGGQGVDTAVFRGNYNDYSIVSGSKSITVIDSVSNRDGTDTLISIERMEFADGVYENGVFKRVGLYKPVADDDTFSVAVNGSVTINVTANDYDPDNQAMTIARTTQAANGTATLNSNGTFTYVPDTNFAGLDSFTYTITDADGLAATATVYIAVGGNVITGTSGNDSSLNGTSGADVILGLAGNDTIAASGGNDIVYGDAGSDTLYGGNGDDKLYGGDGNDNLYGGAGNDYLYGGAGHDRFYGNEGLDQYHGGSGSDQYHFNMSVDTGWAGVNENDAQGSDVIYLTNAGTGNRIEFQLSGGQLNAYWYETELCMKHYRL